MIKKILPVGGRLKNPNVHPDVKHQVILSRHHHLSKLIISDIHYKNAHIGREHLGYFEPFLVKHLKTTRRNQALPKRYGVICTCITTRAVHLELNGDISTDSIILSLRRFISRRGHVKIMKSDSGTNFVGAATEIKERLSILDQTKVEIF